MMFWKRYIQEICILGIRIRREIEGENSMKIRNIFYKLPFIRGILNRMDQSEREIRELRNALRKLDKQYAEAQKEIKRLENEAVKNKEESAVLSELIFSNKRERSL